MIKLPHKLNQSNGSKIKNYCTYNVNRLDDSLEPLTLRWALARESPKIVGFSVSGVIQLKSKIRDLENTKITL